MNMLDLGRVYRTVEDVRGARANRLRLESRAARDKQMQAERQAAMQGDQGALARMVTISPEDAAQFMGAVQAMTATERAEAAKQTELMGRAATAILSAPPDQRAALYAQVRATLPPEMQARVPEKYSEGTVYWALANAVETSDMLKMMMAREKAATGQRNALQLEGVRHQNRLAADLASDQRAGTRAAASDNRLAERQAAADQRLSARQDAAGKRDAEAARLKAEREAELRRSEMARKRQAAASEPIKSADSNAIRRSVADLFGGNYNPISGQISGLGKQDGEQALRVSARAQELFDKARRGGQPITHAQAVQAALDEMGGELPRSGGSSDDPLGILGGN